MQLLVMKVTWKFLTSFAHPVRRIFSYFTMVRHDTNHVAEWPKLDRFQIAESTKNWKSISGEHGECSRVDTCLCFLFKKKCFFNGTIHFTVLLLSGDITAKRRHYLRCIRGALSAPCVQCTQLPKVKAGDRRDYILLYARIKYPTFYQRPVLKCSKFDCD